MLFLVVGSSPKDLDDSSREITRRGHHAVCPQTMTRGWGLTSEQLTNEVMFWLYRAEVVLLVNDIGSGVEMFPAIISTARCLGTPAVRSLSEVPTTGSGLSTFRAYGTDNQTHPDR